MRKMDKEELEGILHDISGSVGAAMPGAEKVGEVLGAIGFKEFRGDVTVPNILRRMRHIIKRVRETYPRLRAREKEGGISWNSLGLERKIEASLGEIQKVVSELDYHKLTLIGNTERFLRTVLSGRARKQGGEPGENMLEIGGFSLSEKCLGACRTCAISARASDPQMPWELFEGALESEHIFIDPNGFMLLRDGEVLLYPKLFEAVERLVIECGCEVGLTTAGLIPPNRELGMEFFSKLSNLGAYASDVNICLSFNFLFGFMRRETSADNYMRCVDETLGMIGQSGARLGGVVVLAPWNDPWDTFKRYEEIKPKIRREHLFNDEDSREDVLGYGDAAESGEATRNGSSPCISRHTSRHILRPDGSLTRYCIYFGTRGSRIGDLTSNSVGQIRELRREHDRRFFDEIVRERGDRCRLHQTWKNGTFTAPKSNNPVIRLRRA